MAAKKMAADLSQIETLKSSGIPILRATFHKTVLSMSKIRTNETPEYAFYDQDLDKNTKSSRKARMWYTPHGILIEQAGRHKLVPLANVADTELL